MPRRADGVRGAHAAHICLVNSKALSIPEQAPKNTAHDTAASGAFELFDHSFTAGATNTNAINNAIRRIASLLGYRQRVTYSDFLHNVARTAQIDVLDQDLATVLAQYRVKRTLDAAGNILGETSMALDSNDLGASGTWV